jgi:hypothetical protein
VQVSADTAVCTIFDVVGVKPPAWQVAHDGAGLGSGTWLPGSAPPANGGVIVWQPLLAQLFGAARAPVACALSAGLSPAAAVPGLT